MLTRRSSWRKEREHVWLRLTHHHPRNDAGENSLQSAHASASYQEIRADARHAMNATNRRAAGSFPEGKWEESGKQRLAELRQIGAFPRLFGEPRQFFLVEDLTKEPGHI